MKGINSNFADANTLKKPVVNSNHASLNSNYFPFKGLEL